MRTRLRKDARLLALFAVLAALPLAIWACADAGDSPGGPSGPGSVYNPNIDYPGATITTSVRPSTVGPGETFGILATFRDGNGLPVEGVPLFISAESGGAPGYFSYQTNPTQTDASGNASIHVTASGACPPDSYGFIIATQRAWSARGYAYVKVGGTPTMPIVTGITLVPTAASVDEGTEATFLATATATAACAVRFQYQATGAGMNVSLRNAPPGSVNPWLFSLPSPLTVVGTLTPGTLTVQVRAYCDGTNEGVVSDPVSVTVNAVP